MGPESVSTELARPVSGPTLSFSPSVGGQSCPGSHGMSGSAGPFSRGGLCPEVPQRSCRPACW